jgi:hypothetical protein
MLQTLRQTTWREAMFSLKTFIAAILALFIAFRLRRILRVINFSLFVFRDVDLQHRA